MSGRWEVLALRYATLDSTLLSVPLDADVHDRMGRMDYFVWVVRDGARVILVDTGFSEAAARARGRTLLRHPVAALASIGIAAEDVADVVITHLHYDHAGNLAAFPNARFHLQDKEMTFATGRYMVHKPIRRPFDVDDVVAAVRLVYREQVVFHDGDYVLAPGVAAHLIGGHSMGLQVLTVEGPRRVVVASDALHLTRLMDRDDAFPVLFDYPATLEGYRRLRELAGEDGIILPGHDPEVLSLWPPVAASDPDTVRIG
ncbi:N-acyl homoserine lactonase family protein [Acuticoccus mangrovi]|uniref:N-acyl homoserine lactonase family protein n=1 Tax=Acuticoccus mangrovi TaxID=2796142 RepID=A0A934IRJ2_9HYPH|nr:N-acyl homoserine lactonase family protein [Acuticoccus mangrovi]MBJ3777335.1 N-acyl homoserine lactonase family protein [Acuticoccus mangrovi]